MSLMYLYITFQEASEKEKQKVHEALGLQQETTCMNECLFA